MAATRFHNVMFALRLAKPTIALSYARKTDSLMGNLGLGEYCLSAGSIDVAALKALFTDIEKRRDELSGKIEKVVDERSQKARMQFSKLSNALFES